MKKILHVIDTGGPGGAETVFVELADRLRQRGFESLTVAGRGGWVEQELSRRGLRFQPLDSKGSLNWRLLFSLVDIIRRENVAMIQSHLLGANVYCGLAGAIARRPVVATFHGTVDVEDLGRFRRIKALALNLGAKQILAVSNRLRDSLGEACIVDTRNVKVIYNGVDVVRYSKELRTSQLRQQLDLDSNARLVGCLGNVRPAKDYGNLIRAAQIVAKKMPDVHFVIGGDRDTELTEQLVAQSVSLGVAQLIHFVGFVKDTPAYLSQLDAFVLSSSTEGFSISTVEAMATGLPVVVTSCGGPQEIVTNEIDGVLVAAQDPDALASSIVRVLANPIEAIAYGERAKKTASDRFSLDCMVTQYAELYGSLLPDCRFHILREPI